MTALDRMIRVYNNAMVRHRSQYYGDSGYFNFGYWSRGATSQSQASEALVDRLLDDLPACGRILDVACGVGASTRALAGRYGAEQVVGINISDVQLAEARKRASACEFLQMDAARLTFPDNSFDAVICVEAAFHFDTRQAFLREAFRVLKPGGSLALSDILFRRTPLTGLFHVPAANLLEDIEAYRSLLSAIGYEAIAIEDATDACLKPFCRGLAAWPASQRMAGAIKPGKALRRSFSYGAVAAYFGALCKAYLLVASRKPVAAADR